MPTPYRDVAHLLRRAAFGGTANEISALAQFDLPVIVDKLVDTTQVPPVARPVEIFDTNQAWGDRFDAFMWWWFDRMATTPSPLAEKMTIFWHGHFTSSLTKTDYQNMWNQIDMFRIKGMGSFRDLAQTVAVSPAMLQWLDNESNIKTRPNENFARECMELFTVGVNQYTQFDVTESARAWTGHGLSNDTHTYVFTATRHDANNKTIFGVTKNWNGPDVIDELCLGVKKPLTARFIAKKLWEWFAYEGPETIVLDSITSSFSSSNLDITALLRAIFLRPEFYSERARHGHVRSPVEYLVAMMRHLGLDAKTAHPEWYLAVTGQALLQPPNVAGWKPNRNWVSTSSMWSRSNAARNNMWTARSHGFLTDTATVSIQTAVQRTLDAFGIEEASQSTRKAMEAAVYNERYARGWAEGANLIQLGLLCPEFQAG